MSGPDFVCIGAQKAGTTWLYDNLVHHPSVWMPPVKEIHFFNTVAPHRELLGLEGDKHPRNLLRRYAPFWQRPTPARARWLYHFFQGDKTIDWYRRLYTDMPASCLGGDITPAYSTLDERGVEFAHRVLKSDCRVFIILRHPVERHWSGIKMNFRATGRDIGAADLAQIQREVDHPGNRARSNYAAMLQLWSSAFGSRFKVFLYDDMLADPYAFLFEVEDFLGLAKHTDGRALAAPSNVDTRKVSMPASVRTLLEERYRDQIGELERWVPGISARWGL